MPRGESIQPKDSDGAINNCSVCGLSLGSGDHSECLRDKGDIVNESKDELTAEEQESLGEMIKYLSSGDIDNAIKINDEALFPDSVLQESKMQEVFKQSIIEKISIGDFDGAIKIKYAFYLPKELINSSEIKGIVKKSFFEYLSNGEIDKTQNIIHEFALPDEVYQESEVQEVAKQGIVNKLFLEDNLDDNIADALEIKEKFSLSDEVFHDAVKEAIIKRTPEYYIYNTINLIRSLSLPKEMLQQPEIQDVVKEAVIHELDNSWEGLKGLIKKSFEIKKEFSLSDEVFHDAVKEAIIKRLSRNNVYEAINIIDKLSLPEEMLQLPELQEAAKKVITEDQYGGIDVDEFLAIKEKFSISDEVFNDAAKKKLIGKLSSGGRYLHVNNSIDFMNKTSLPEEMARDAAKEGIINVLKISGDNAIKNAFAIKKSFSLPDEILQQPEFREAAKKALLVEISTVKNSLDDFFDVVYKFGFSESDTEILDIARQGMMNRLNEGSGLDMVMFIKQRLDISDEVLQLPEFQSAVEVYIVENLKYGHIDNALKILSELSLSDEILLAPTIQATVKEGLIKVFNSGYGIRAIKFKDVFSLTDEFLQDPEIKKAIKNGMMRLLIKGAIDEAIKIKDTFSLSEEEVQDVIKWTMYHLLHDGYVDTALKVINEFSLTDEFLKTTEVQEQTKHGLEQLLYNDYVNTAAKLVDNFYLPEEFVNESFSTYIEESIENYKLDLILSHLDKFPEKVLESIENKYYLLSYRNELNLDNLEIYNEYLRIKQENDQIEKGDLVEKMKDVIRNNSKSFIKKASKKIWIEIFGDEAMRKILDSLPKETDEKRNAFTHNEYDRTSVFIASLDSEKEKSEFVLNKDELEVLSQYIERFKLSKAPLLYRYFKALVRYEQSNVALPKDMKKEGITSLEELELRIDRIQDMVYSEQPITELPELSKLEVDLLSTVTGKSSHRFDVRRPNMEKIIADYKENQDNGEIEPTPEEYKSFSIILDDAEIKFDASKAKKDFMILQQEINNAIEHLGSIDNLQVQAQEIMQEEVKELQVILESKPDNQFINTKIEQFQKVVDIIKNSKSLDQLLGVLLEIEIKTLKNSGLEPVIREIILQRAFSENYSALQVDEISASMKRGISSDSILRVLNLHDEFIKEHVLNVSGRNDEQFWSDETWKKITRGKKSSKHLNLGKVFQPRLKALRETAENFETVASGNSNEVRAIPDRGLIGEMSGYLADVCYTAEYPLLKKYDNVIPFKFVVPDDETGESKFIGSVLVFELKTDDGEKALMVRGFDVPKEDKYDINKFIETFLDQMQEVAVKRGATKIIIPGDQGAMSNYRMTINHLNKSYKQSENKVSLSGKFAFNNYDLTNNSYVAREV